jgi:hypothetical protein
VLGQRLSPQLKNGEHDNMLPGLVYCSPWKAVMVENGMIICRKKLKKLGITFFSATLTAI